MTAEQASLWQRIEAFALDEPGAESPFSARLAHEQGWSAVHTQRVVVEYKRFAFLAVAAGHVVTPSKAVDEAWHLHLIYTRNYWEKFCAQALGKPLHHEPARGGSEDEVKFAGCYKQTRQSYAQFFGVEPPADIWPAPASDAAPVRAKQGWRNWSPLALVSVAFAGCSGAAMGSLGPFDLRGPDFLIFYCWFAPAVFILAFGLRWWLHGTGPLRMRLTSLTNEDPYKVAALVGLDQALGVALTHLSSRYLLRAGYKSHVLRSQGTLPAEAPAIERRIHELASDEKGVNREDLRVVTEEEMRPTIATLREEGLLLDESAVLRARYLPFFVALFVPVAGCVKVVVGLNRGRPVEFLVILCALTGGLTLLFLQRPWRTRAGDMALDRLRGDHAHLKRRLPNGALLGAESVMVAALFGASVWPLAVTAMHTALKPESSIHLVRIRARAAVQGAEARAAAAPAAAAAAVINRQSYPVASLDD